MKTTKSSQFIICIFCSWCIFLILPVFLSGQENDIYKQDSVWKEQQEYLNRRYIPMDEDDAFRVLEEISAEEGLSMFRNASEGDIKGKLHFGLGGWIMQNWGFYTGSRLSYYLNRKGLFSADDMVEYIILAFHRHLNQKPIKSESIIDSLNGIHRKKYQERLKNATRLDTLFYDRKTGEIIERPNR